MGNYEYAIVGSGFGAMFFAHRLIAAGKQFLLFNDGRKSASRVSAGIANPVVLKKFTTFWLAEEQLRTLKETFAEMEAYLGANFFINENIKRIFHDETEKQTWLNKSNKKELDIFLSKEFDSLERIRNPFGSGTVMQSARVDVPGFFLAMEKYLEVNSLVVKEAFDHSALKGSSYKDYTFQKIVFCEGIGVKNNPFFSGLPIVANKGHRLVAELQNPLPFNFTVKKKHFLFPLSNGRYYYGGTYDAHFHNDGIDQQQILQLHDGLNEIYPDNFIVEDVEYGYRPTVRDRRPILGAAPGYENYFIFNGLGARGLLNGAYFSEILYQHIESSTQLPPEVDMRRFDSSRF